MGVAPSRMPANAKSTAAQTCGEFRTTLRLTEALMQKAQNLWTQDIAAHVASRSGKCVRTAEYWLAGDRDLKANDLLRLIESDVGLEILDAFMETIPEIVRLRWWELQQLNMKLARAERRAAQSVRERDQLRLDLGNGKSR